MARTIRTRPHSVAGTTRIGIRDASAGVRALGRTAAFILSMAPGPASRLVARLTPDPVVEQLAVPGPDGPMTLDLYRPPTQGPHPGVLLSLGVLPLGVVDPRTAAVARAFARAGFVALVYWSPATRELRLDPDDLPIIRTAYEVLLEQPSVDPARSGLMGVCVGGSFALIAAADPAIAKRIAFVAVHAPFASLRTLATAIAAESRVVDGVREPWPVDPLTWQVYVRSVTETLPPADSERLRAAFEPKLRWNADRTAVVRSRVGTVDVADLSGDGRAVLALLGAGSGDVEHALRALPPGLRARLAAMSPLTQVARIRAPLLLLLHDRHDHLIPVTESRRLWAALDGRPGAHYTELGFRHLRVPHGWSPLRIAREMARGYFAWYPLFRAIDPPRPPQIGVPKGAAMPAARRLFRRAILQSGAADHILPDGTALRIGDVLAARLGIEPTLAAFAKVPAERVLAAHEELKADLIAHPDPRRWGAEVVANCMLMQPVVDGDVITAEPIELIRAGSAADVDVLIGTNEDDWRLFLAASGTLPQITDEVVAGPVAASGSLSAEAYGMAAEAGLAAYRAHLPTAAPGEVLAAIETDWWCRVPALRLADAHAHSGGGRTFMYEFAWPSPLAGGMFGACHALEIPFVFDTLDEGAGQLAGNLLGDTPPQGLASAMHQAWVSFAATGDPGWPPYDLERRATMRFGADSAVVDDPRPWERRVWDGLR